MAPGPTTVTREKLYEQVWAKPMSHLAKEYGVSDVALAKTCRRLNIPVPPRGYWAKVQHGRLVMKRPALPKAANGQRNSARITPGAPAPRLAIVDPVITACVAAQQDPEMRVRVAEQLRNPHPAVRPLMEGLPGARLVEHARTAATTGSSSRGLSISVTPASRRRALALLDALVKGLERHGCEVSDAGVTVEGHTIPLGVTEKSDRIPHVNTPAEQARQKDSWPPRLPKWDYQPNGQLTLAAEAYTWWRQDVRKKWSDRKNVKLEVMLDEVLADVVAIGVALRQRDEEKKREAERKAELERERKERERLARMEAARCADIIASSEAWVKADAIRRFAAEVARTMGGAPASEKAEAWLARASKVAHDLDPIARGVDAMLGRHDAAAQEVADEHTANLHGWTR